MDWGINTVGENNDELVVSVGLRGVIYFLYVGIFVASKWTQIHASNLGCRGPVEPREFCAFLGHANKAATSGRCGFRLGVRGQEDASSASLLLNPLSRRREVEGKHSRLRRSSG